MIQKIRNFARKQSLQTLTNMDENKADRNFSFKSKGTFTLMGSVLVAVALLVYFLPRESKSGYEFEQGRPWRYNSLIATFDFPIYKTAEEVKAERDSALRDFLPFYKENPQTEATQMAAYRTDLARGSYHDVPAACRMHVAEMLKKVYDAGIVESSQMAEMAQRRTPGVRIVEGTEAQSRILGELFTTRSAYEYIMHADTVHFPREMMARCNINKYLEVNLTEDLQKTESARDDLLAAVSPASGMVQSGQRIIDRGEIISSDQYKILQSFLRETELRSKPSDSFRLVVVGQTLFILCLLGAFVLYLKLFRRDFLVSPHSILLLSTLITIFPLLTYILTGHNLINAYLIPYAMVPMFVRIFMDSRTAFMAMVCSIILSSLALYGNYEFLVVQFVGGMTSICAMKELTERSQLMKVALFVVASSWIVMLGYDLSQGIDFAHLDRTPYFHIMLNGVLLLFAYPLMFLVEKAFGFTSSVTLIELSNTNHPLLRMMSKEAQGTFVHSMQVANLAAEVADKIGAKPQLARTGALYHDIGKTLNPAFFTENQNGKNPHDELSEERSAQIIISHVTEGLKLADKNHLPKVIRDFISTHHGRSKVKYFYIQWKNKHPNEEPDPKMFTYPGPNPFTREQAILMMCDAVEATSRSLKEFSEESIKELVDRIVDGQMAEGYFKECPITFRDIADAKRVLVESLKTIYHTRIAYPELNSHPADPVPQPRRPYFFGAGRRHS